MATAKEFVAHVAKINGVSGCLLVRNDGALLGQNLDDPERYSALLLLAAGLATEIQDKAGFSHCRHISFNCTGQDHFHIFPIDRYLLGIVQNDNNPGTINAVYRLTSRVSTGRNDMDHQGS